MQLDYVLRVFSPRFLRRSVEDKGVNIENIPHRGIKNFFFRGKAGWAEFEAAPEVWMDAHEMSMRREGGILCKTSRSFNAVFSAACGVSVQAGDLTEKSRQQGPVNVRKNLSRRGAFVAIAKTSMSSPAQQLRRSYRLLLLTSSRCLSRGLRCDRREVLLAWVMRHLCQVKGIESLRKGN